MAFTQDCAQVRYAKPTYQSLHARFCHALQRPSVGQKTPISDFDATKGLGLREVQLLARGLAALAESLGSPEPFTSASTGDRRRLVAIARAVLRERTRRAEHFPPGLFGEPAWDILLDLFVAWLGGEERLVKEACIASQVPEATALRYIDMLMRAGLVERRPDMNDQRRKFVSLSAEGRSRMRDYFEAMPFIGSDPDLLRTLGIGEPEKLLRRADAEPRIGRNTT